MRSDKIFAFALIFCSVYDISSGQQCGSELTNSRGRIASQGHPNSYPSYHSCSWTIKTTNSYDIVNLVFRDFNIEPGETCEYDSLHITTRIYDEKFCGDKLTDVGNNGRISLRGSVRLNLETDDSVNLRGFALSYSIIPGQPPTTTLPTTTIPATTPPPTLTCDDQPCMNGGECSMIDQTEFYCFCQDGFHGGRCENDRDECESNPCENGGTCVDGNNSWSCDCPEGFYGETCGIDNDECQADPCKNGATCQDGANSFFCACPRGWTGWDCDTDIDECVPDPCQNSGFCEDHLGYYSCFCHPKYTGQNCTVELQEEPTISPEEVLDAPDVSPQTAFTPTTTTTTTTTITVTTTSSPDSPSLTTERPAPNDPTPKDNKVTTTISSPEDTKEGDENLKERPNEEEEVQPQDRSTYSSTQPKLTTTFLITTIEDKNSSTYNSSSSTTNQYAKFPVLALVSSVAGFLVVAIIFLLLLYCCKFASKNKQVHPIQDRSAAAPY